jgi:REP element-mobilizing transposase RayT
MKEIFENVSKKMDYESVEFNEKVDYVYLLMECLSRLTLSKIVNSLKGV